MLTVKGRYLFAFLASVGNMICLLGRDSMRIATLEMKMELNLTEADNSNILSKELTKIILNNIKFLGGYSYGMLGTMLLGGPLADTLGGKWVLVLVTLVSSSCTLLVPLLAPLSTPALVCVQVVSGLGGGLVVPALSSMIARWEPVSETGKLATIIYTGSQLSMVFSSIFTGYISYSYNWQLAFYLLGSVPLLWTIPWLLLVDDDPSKSRLTSELERDMLREETQSSDFRPSLRNIPILRIFSSSGVIAVIAANIGVSWANSHTSLLMPQFIDGLGYPIFTTSILSTISFIGTSVIGLISPHVFSLIRRYNISTTVARKLSCSICLVGFSILTFPTAFIDQESYPILIIVLGTFSCSLLGFNLVGAWGNPQDISPNYVGTIMGIMGFFNEITRSVVLHTKTLITSQVVDDEVWPILFILASGVTVVANGVYLMLGTSETQEWDSLSESKENLSDEKNPKVFRFHTI